MVDGLKLVQVIDASSTRPDSIIKNAVDDRRSIALLRRKTN